jgi:hypothetical protein
MTFLPIVGRELRVAARGRFTFWSRLAAAGFALLIFGATQLLLQNSGGIVGAGQAEFSVLKWLAFIYACAAGLFLTSDSLSEEKREGTLGLLFLTDLRGYDVVFGKLLTQSLRAFYGLLAAFPIMGLALLAGGVTGAEFWQSILAICNTLFFSLSLGMLVSSFSRDSTKAMNGTVLLILLIFAGLPCIEFVLAAFDDAKFNPLLTLASPGYLFTHTGGYRFTGYWVCLILQNALAWTFLLFASFWTPRSWQEKSAASSTSRPSLAYRWRFGSPRSRLATRRKLLDQNPLLWLTLRDRWLSRLVWWLTVTFLAARIWGLMAEFQQTSADASSRIRAAAASGGTNSWGGTVIYSSTNSSSGTFTVSTSAPQRPARNFLVGLTSTVNWLLHVVLFLWVASQASRFFVDAVRNGAMELLLVTPVYPAQIVRAQWHALCRTFLLPTLCVALLHLAGGILSAAEIQSQMGPASAGPSTYHAPDMGVYLIGESVISTITTVAAVAAVAWFGMWMGLTNRKVSVAVLKTVCFVLVLPWIALTFIRGFSMVLLIPAGSFGNPTMALLIPAVITGVLGLGKDVFFIRWGWLRLNRDFRDALTRDQSHRFRSSAPNYQPPPPAIMPVPPPFNAA